MGKKPADQTSTNGTNGAGDAVDLETELDDEQSGGADSEEDDDDSEDDQQDAGNGAKGGRKSIQQQIEEGIAAALPTISRTFQSEMDRRINSALNKSRKGGQRQQATDEDDDQQDQGRQAQPAADVRGARIAFREYLPETIKLLSAEERNLANDFGQNLIRARALQGFDDEDQTGREVAEQTAEFLKKARSFYSARTRRVLEKQGALVKQGGGQSPTGSDAPPSVAGAFEAARKKDMELFPHRYANQQQGQQ